MPLPRTIVASWFLFDFPDAQMFIVVANTGQKDGHYAGKLGFQMI
jgi:hypothetical protein